MQQAHVVLGQQHAARVLEHRGLVLAHPHQLGRGEAGHGDVAGDLASARLGLLERARTAASLRPSFHRMAGRSGLSAASSSVAPCIWPDRPTAFTALRSCAGSALTAALVALHQSAGFCSDQPACGRETLSGADACSTTVSLSSTRTALTLDVPISMPRYIRPPRKISGGNATRNARRGDSGGSQNLPVFQPAAVRTLRPCRSPAQPVGRLAREHPLRVFARQRRGIA